ncbi:MAG: hypothetical protein AMJ65_04605 [Phycisphaerae bacterium SG8_4]|nr:MAG: hypothetical protein AMJ65_04605 [Phycisphaerae bacterium SG8_4]
MCRYVVIMVISLCASMVGCVSAAVPGGVNLSDLANWDIVVADNAPPSELYAAEEFQSHFAKASGVNLPIVSQSAPATRGQRHVFIGASVAMRESAVGFETDEFGQEGFRIIVRDDNIAIAGRPQSGSRGTLYGVYTFLEDYVGVRFLTVDHTYVPAIGTWRVVGPLDRFYHPPLRFRWSYYGETNRNPAFAARIRVNTVTGDKKLGGKTGLNLINHSFHHHLSSQKYGKEHPEYFALVDGERKLEMGGGGPELCLTNPDVLRIVTESVLDDLKKNPNMENISVSQNDNNKYCRCSKCAEIDEREETPMGSLLTFVNAVADEVAKEYPDVMVGTLSYWYSRKPPKTIKPRPNVQIQLCSIECCLLHPINDPQCRKNVQFCQDMADWGKICSNISIWNYNTNFSNYLLPCPNLRVIESNIRYFVANNAIGIFMQAAGNALGAELSDLRNYVMANLLWDPTRSGEKLANEFLDLHYGRSARPIRRFITLTHENALASGLHPNCFGRAKDYAIDETIAQAGLDAFAEALELAEEDVVRARVEKASICAYRAAIEPIWYTKDKSSVEPDLAERMRPLVKRFLDLCEKYGVTNASERSRIEDEAKRLRSTVGL